MSPVRTLLFAMMFSLLICVTASGQFPATISSTLPLNSNAASDSGGDSRPQIATDGQGHWVAVWQSNENADPDILVSRSMDNGVTWSPSASLDPGAASDSGDAFNPQVITDGQGHWVAVWESSGSVGGLNGSDYDILISRSNDNGETWTPPAALNANAASDTGDDERPQIATDDQGHWVAVWHSDEHFGGSLGTDRDILVARSIDNGETWTFPAPLSTNATSDTADENLPRIATDHHGKWVVVWEFRDNSGGPLGTDSDIVFSRSEDNGASWTPPEPLNTNAASDTGGDTGPQIATDGNGTWVAVWETEDSLGGTIGNDGDILVSRSTDNAATWSAPAALNANADSDSIFDQSPLIITDSLGRWVTVWEASNSLGGSFGTDLDIFISLSSDDGVTWTPPDALNDNAGGDTGTDDSPQIATDNRGNWKAVWGSDDSLGGTIGTDDDILTAHFALPDCNGNGVGDAQDIADANSSDCDGDGVPDECESDSDGDGVIDACDNCVDIANVDQADTDGNGIGDACTPASGCGACGAGASGMLTLAGACMAGFRNRRRRHNH